MTSDPRAQRSPFWIGAILLCSLLMLALCIFAFRHLLRTAFWYDESMQFWMSLGADAFGSPYSAPGTLRDAIRQNAASNLDPGGFGILLRFWLQLGRGEIWQRLLPLLFFALGIGGAGWIGWTLRPSALFALLCAGVPALYPLLLDYASEVRAYSMELAGVIVGCALIDRLLQRPAIPAALGCGTILGFFLTSRYSFALFAAAACLSLAWSSLGPSGGRKAAWLNMLAFAAPIACSAAIVFVLALWPQYRGRMTYHDGELLQYLANATAAGKSAGEIAAMAWTNLFSPPGIPLTLAALIGLLALIPARWREKLRFGGARLDDGLAAFGVLALAAIALTALLWPWHPWDMTTKWSLWLHAVSAVALIRLAARLLNFASPLSDRPREPNGRVAALLLAGILALDLRLGLYQRPDGGTIVPAIAYLDHVTPPAGSIAVDPHWYPTLRYFYEYGYLAGSTAYPAWFRLPDRNGPTPLVGSDTQYLMTGMATEDAQKSFAPAIIVRDPKLPDQLFRVENAGRQDP